MEHYSDILKRIIHLKCLELEIKVFPVKFATKNNFVGSAFVLPIRFHNSFLNRSINIIMDSKLLNAG